MFDEMQGIPWRDFEVQLSTPDLAEACRLANVWAVKILEELIDGARSGNKTCRECCENANIDWQFRKPDTLRYVLKSDEVNFVVHPSLCESYYEFGFGLWLET